MAMGQFMEEVGGFVFGAKKSGDFFPAVILGCCLKREC